METHKTYYEGLCDRLHDLSIHYSTVRMVIISFLIPLGAIMIIEGRCAVGSYVIFTAWGLNLWFGKKSLKKWLEHRNIDLWLDIGDTTQPYDLEYKEPVPGYWQLVLWRLPKKDTFKSPKECPQHWKDGWGKALIEARKMERPIQLIILLGVIGLFLVFLFT